MVIRKKKKKCGDLLYAFFSLYWTLSTLHAQTKYDDDGTMTDHTRMGFALINGWQLAKMKKRIPDMSLP